MNSHDLPFGLASHRRFNRARIGICAWLVTAGLPPFADGADADPPTFFRAAVVASRDIGEADPTLPALDEIMRRIDLYFREASYGRMGFRWQAYGPYVFAHDPSRVLGEEAMRVADPDIDYTQYDTVVVIDRRNGGPPTGSIGPWLPQQTDDGVVVLGLVSVNPGHFSSPSGFGTVLHELGHNLGCNHASLLDCRAETLSGASGDCTSQTYGDPYDVMGQSGNAGHLNAVFKSRIGWLDPTNLLEVVADGTYTLQAYETGQGLLALKFPAGIAWDEQPRHYYLEYRTARGFDATAVNAFQREANGPQLRLYPGLYPNPTTPHLLDFTPQEDAPRINHALSPGLTFVDPSGLTLTTLHADADSATVRIRCVANSCAGLAVVAPVADEHLSRGDVYWIRWTARDLHAPRWQLTLNRDGQPAVAVDPLTLDEGIDGWRAAWLVSADASTACDYDLTILDTSTGLHIYSGRFCIDPAPIVPRFAGWRWENGHFTTRLVLEVGTRYVLEGTASLASPDWTPLTRGVATELATPFVDSESPVHQRYYRFRLE